MFKICIHTIFQLIEMGVQVNQETMETGTTIDNQMNELHMNFEKVNIYLSLETYNHRGITF